MGRKRGEQDTQQHAPMSLAEAVADLQRVLSDSTGRYTTASSKPTVYKLGTGLLSKQMGEYTPAEYEKSHLLDSFFLSTSSTWGAHQSLG